MSVLPVQYRGGALEMGAIEPPTSRLPNDGYTLLIARNTGTQTRSARLRAIHSCTPGVPPHVDTFAVASGGSLHLFGPFERIFNSGLIASITWLDEALAPLGDGAGMAVGAISMKTRPRAPAPYVPPAGVLSLQTTTPALIPVVDAGGALTHFVHDRLGNRYLFQGGEALLVRNDRGASVLTRVLARYPCTHEIVHTLDTSCATGVWTLVAPVEATIYRTPTGYGEFLILAANGSLLADNTGVGVAVIRLRRNLA